MLGFIKILFLMFFGFFALVAIALCASGVAKTNPADYQISRAIVVAPRPVPTAVVEIRPSDIVAQPAVRVPPETLVIVAPPVRIPSSHLSSRAGR
jgi:hypothetical protein